MKRGVSKFQRLVLTEYETQLFQATMTRNELHEYNISFADGFEMSNVRRFRNVENNHCERTKHESLTLPLLQQKKTTSQDPERRISDMALDVRGLRGRTDEKIIDTTVKRPGKRSRKKRKLKKRGVHGFSPVNNKDLLDHQTDRTLSLPMIDSTSLTSPRLACLDEKRTALPGDVSVVYNLLAKEIGKRKMDQKKTSRRFRRDIVEGKQKPIVERLFPSID